MPNGVVTVTLTVPLPAGALVITSVELSTCAGVATPPKLTVTAPVRLVPMTATGSPPPAGPETGVIEVRVGVSPTTTVFAGSPHDVASDA